MLNHGDEQQEDLKASPGLFVPICQVPPAWSWDEIAGPVMDRLGTLRIRRDAEHWPRVLWCVPGLLSLLPLYAACHHATRSDAARRTVIDCVVSSYIPTIRMLNHA